MTQLQLRDPLEQMFPTLNTESLDNVSIDSGRVEYQDQNCWEHTVQFYFGPADHGYPPANDCKRVMQIIGPYITAMFTDRGHTPVAITLTGGNTSHQYVMYQAVVHTLDTTAEHGTEDPYHVSMVGLSMQPPAPLTMDLLDQEFLSDLVPPRRPRPVVVDEVR